MKAIVSVIGKDKSGIIAKVATALAENGVNIEDISQTIVQGNFTMIMVCDLGDKISVAELGKVLDKTGREAGVTIRVQHEDIFNAMHSL
ncbi:MAG: ACT domain-containing protein [Clostridia bacterium]|nr:ACT domain-containing protein [Clostridia bacterium]